MSYKRAYNWSNLVKVLKLPALAIASQVWFFLLGTDTQLTSGEGAANFLKEAGCRLAIVEQRQSAKFLEALGDKKDDFEKAATVEGY